MYKGGSTTHLFYLYFLAKLQNMLDITNVSGWTYHSFSAISIKPESFKRKEELQMP